MKKSLIIVAVIVLIAGFYTGKKLQQKNIKNNLNIETEVDNRIIADEEVKNTGEKTLVNSNKTVITPNTKIVKKTYYKDCNHIIKTVENAPEELVNLTEEELKEKIKNSEVQKFTTEEVVIYIQMEDYCHEHYLLKDNEGYLGIYQLDKKGEILELFEQTEIPIDFLPEEDKEKVKTGIRVNTKQELYKIIEDFE